MEGTSPEIILKVYFPLWNSLTLFVRSLVPICIMSSSGSVLISCLLTYHLKNTWKIFEFHFMFHSNLFFQYHSTSNHLLRWNFTFLILLMFQFLLSQRKFLKISFSVNVFSNVNNFFFKILIANSELSLKLGGFFADKLTKAFCKFFKCSFSLLGEVFHRFIFHSFSYSILF